MSSEWGRESTYVWASPVILIHTKAWELEPYTQDDIQTLVLGSNQTFQRLLLGGFWSWQSLRSRRGKLLPFSSLAPQELAWLVLLACHEEKNRVLGLLLIIFVQVQQPYLPRHGDPWSFWGSPLAWVPEYLWTFLRGPSLQLWHFWTPTWGN